ncbi:toxin-antitoxin system YwqK family antitoxin [Formosa undariae]|uniref:Toxin-antitoxin system YwqK family antitoxin n=1 Tax=Formosa undariae TaxID=1325436 RepID=A0ABV5F4U1_9FLAO
MAQKEHLHSKHISVRIMKCFVFKFVFILASLCAFLSCVDGDASLSKMVEDTKLENTSNYAIDTRAIPNDTIAFSNPSVTYVNGKYLLHNKPYLGIVFKVLKGYHVKTYSSVLDGKLHGTYRSFYANGNRYEVRTYNYGQSTGVHYGYWESNGKLKFEYHYINQKKEGTYKNWFENGDLANNYNYKDDRLYGLQRAWRLNGSLYRNFVVKNGVRYGLQKAKSCFELSNEKVIRQAGKADVN